MVVWHLVLFCDTVDSWDEVHTGARRSICHIGLVDGAFAMSWLAVLIHRGLIRDETSFELISWARYDYSF